jgi:TPR repeat protein/antitoxin component YwqK of YwqJK toxin-antitoxin module
MKKTTSHKTGIFTVVGILCVAGLTIFFPQSYDHSASVRYGKNAQKIEKNRGDRSWINDCEIDQVVIKDIFKNVNGHVSTVTRYENGQVMFKGIRKNGLRDGPWISCHDDGTLWEMGNYYNGKPEGPWVRYFKDGSIDKKFAGNYKSGKLQSPVVASVKDSQKINKHNNGKKEGFWLTTYSNGNVKSNGNYKNGKPNGLWLYYHDNGQLDEIVTYKKDKKEPLRVSTEIIEPAQKKENGHFENGEKVGEWEIVTKIDDMSFYVDLETIFEKGKYIYWMDLASTSVPNKFGHMSSKMYRQGDCKSLQVKSLNLSFFKEPMAMGVGQFIETESEWNNPTPESAADIVLRKVCSNVVRNDHLKKAVNALKSGDFETTLREWGVLAKQGDPGAHSNIGLMYLKGDGVAQDYKKAKQWFLKAAELGQDEASFYLGIIYQHGLGVSKNIDKAVEWWTAAAEKGYAKAQSNLGMIYVNGESVKQDYKAALKWFLLAAKQGREVAQSNLGVMYKNGHGGPKSYVNAAKWFELAANQGNTIAKKQLGIVLTELGRDLRKDNKSCSDMYACKKALSYYYRAAEVQNTDAMAYISLVLWTMEKKITPKVYMWWVLSDRVGIKDPQRRQDIQKGLAELKDNTSLNNTVQQLADECIRKGYKGC